VKSATELLLEQVNVNATFLRVLAAQAQRTVSASDVDAQTAQQRDQQAEREPEAFK